MNAPPLKLNGNLSAKLNQASVPRLFFTRQRSFGQKIYNGIALPHSLHLVEPLTEVSGLVNGLDSPPNTNSRLAFPSWITAVWRSRSWRALRASGLDRHPSTIPVTGSRFVWLFRGRPWRDNLQQE